MKRAVVVLLLLAAGYFGYRRHSDSRAPEKRYEAFAEEILHRRYDAAAEMCDGLTAADLQRSGSQEQIGAGTAMFQTIFPSRFAIEAKETSPDGEVTLRGAQTVLFNPAGVESALRPAMYARLNQVVKLRSTESGWKVTAFENKFEKMDSMKDR